MVEVTEINIQIMHLLAQGKTLTHNQIISKLKQYKRKDVKYSIRRLREKGLIKVIPNLLDMRRVFYRLATPDEIQNLDKVKDIERETYNQLVNIAHTSTTSLEEMEAAAHS